MHGWFVVVNRPYATTDSNGNYNDRKRAPRKLHREPRGRKTMAPNGKGERLRPENPELPISRLKAK